MDLQGPLPADYENVRALNTAFLELLRDDANARRFLEALPLELACRLQRLSKAEIERLAKTPFLLFSFRERDDRFWRDLLRGDGRRDLFSVQLNAKADISRVAAAGLGFVWQLANRNPFAARLICGASAHWCEQICEYTFFHLLEIAGHRVDLLVLRARDDIELWKKLVDIGLSEEIDARAAAQISAMQYILMRQPHAANWRAAACASRDPAFKVVQKPKS